MRCGRPVWAWSIRSRHVCLRCGRLRRGSVGAWRLGQTASVFSMYRDGDHYGGGHDRAADEKTVEVGQAKGILGGARTPVKTGVRSVTTCTSTGDVHRRCRALGRGRVFRRRIPLLGSAIKGQLTENQRAETSITETATVAGTTARGQRGRVVLSGGYGAKDRSTQMSRRRWFAEYRAALVVEGLFQTRETQHDEKPEQEQRVG